MELMTDMQAPSAHMRSRDLNRGKFFRRSAVPKASSSPEWPTILRAVGRAGFIIYRRCEIQYQMRMHKDLMRQYIVPHLFDGFKARSRQYRRQVVVTRLSLH